MVKPGTKFALIFIVALTSCAPVALWVQPGVSEEQSFSDLNTCKLQAQQTTPEPQLTPPPVFGDGQFVAAEQDFINHLIDFFIEQVKILEAKNTDIVLTIQFGANELSVLRSELDNSFAGKVVYESSSDELDVKSTYLRMLNILSFSPQVDIIELWNKWDENDRFTIVDERTTASATQEALDNYNLIIDAYLDDKDQPILDSYENELRQKTSACMASLGYTPKP